MNPDNLRHPSAILKVIEIVMLIIIMALYFSQGPLGSWTQYVSSVFIGCFINAIILLTLIFMGYDQIQKTPLELMLYTFYGISLFVSAILLFTIHNGPWICAGVFSLILLAAYFADWFYAFTNLNGHPPALSPGGEATSQQTSSSQANQGVPVGFAFQPNQQTRPDTVDYGATKQEVFHTNPVYPTTMNYPPDDLHVDLPPEYPANIPTGPRP